MQQKALLIGLIVLLVSIPVCRSETPAAQLQLTWTDNSDDEEGFEIERETTSTFDSIAIVEGDVTTFTDWGLAPGTTYCYRVRAFSIYGYSGYSNEACATTSVTLTVIPVGSGSVSSVPVGINCPMDCSMRYVGGTIVTLMATPFPGSAFAGWSGGGCTGTGICLFNLNADTSVAATFTITDSPLLLTRLVPSSASAGGASFTLTVNGSNLIAGSVVQWNGLARTTTYVSNSQLAAAISADDIAAPGVDQVTVVNPAPGGGNSNALTFTVTPDPTPPDSSITAAPTNPSNSTSANFSFTSSAVGSSFQCRADGAMFAACTNPWTYSNLITGSHTFQVRAVSLVGYIDPTPASYTWTIDTTPLDTGITAAPTNPSNSTSASFSFTSNKAGSSFQCRVDGASFAACANPWSYSNLGTGSHTFQVRAIDLAGNIDPTPASYTWTIDTTPPDTSITAAPTNPSNSSNASFSFTSNEAGSSFQCQLDGGVLVSCTSPRSYTKLAIGSHTFQVRAIDLVGNIDPTPASYTWTIDTARPDTSITAAPTKPSTNNSASFSFTSNEAGSSFQCRLDGASFAACTNPWSYSNLVTGSHTFQVRATDLAGNIDSTPASYTWTYTPVTRFPNNSAIDAGSLQGGAAANLSTDDNKFYQVNSTTSGTRATSWYGIFTSVPKNLSNLKVTYKGKNSQNCTQAIALWRWTDNSWVQLDSRAVGTTEISIADLVAAGALSEYVSGTIGNGDLRLQVRCTGGSSNFYASGNLMKIVYNTL